MAANLDVNSECVLISERARRREGMMYTTSNRSNRHVAYDVIYARQVHHAPLFSQRVLARPVTRRYRF
jgi:hypothetical protein